MNPINPHRKNIKGPKEIIPLAFPGISDIEIDNLLAFSQIKHYPITTILCREGNFESKFYILIDGEVEVTKTINNSEERKLKVLTSGDFFGEMGIMHDAPRAASVTASTPVTVLEIDKDNFDRVIQHSSTIPWQWFEKLANVFEKMMRQPWKIYECEPMSSGKPIRNWLYRILLVANL